MPYQNHWSRRASHDLTRIVEYLDSRDPDWTDAIVAAIIGKIDSLADNPYLSSVFDQSDREEVREALAGSYRIFFTIDEDARAVVVKRIQHVRQQDPDFSE
jgi:plasmid stabilization system protein ParE